MSYLTDEPLSPEEEEFYKRSVRNYYIQKAGVPSSKHIYLNASRNKSRSDYGISDFKKLVNDYYKVKVSNKMFIINQTTYDHLLNNIKGRWGNRPINDLITCDSITIHTIPHKRCSLYYHAGSNQQGDTIEFELIGSFVADDYERTLTISCPYTDSFWQNDNHLIFNWFGNDKSGKIIPKTIQANHFVLPYANQTLPFLSPKVYGCFMIMGIQDTIGFNVTCNVDADWNYRNGKRYNHVKRRHVHIPRQVMRREDGIGYEIPSQDYMEDPNAPDPLYDLFNE